MIYAGIDAGSRAIKIALLDADTQEIVASGVTDQGIKNNELTLQLFNELLEESGHNRSEVARIVATGYARNIVSIADSTITEISCHACGVRHLVKDVRTVVEIGGQDSKLLQLDEHGILYDFSMNDRCAAGTGRFLEVVADRFGLETPKLGELAARSANPAAISSMCVIFAETEIIGLLASGALPEDIVAGVQVSIARRVASMAGRNITDPVVFTGGVAMVNGMREALESALKRPISVSPHPQLTGALGAALLAARKA
jgi:predicted CoA-substrate-specific enzyme activase